MSNKETNLKNGWYLSTNGIIHRVVNNHYLCNRAVGVSAKAELLNRAEKYPYNLESDYCKRCKWIILKRPQKHVFLQHFLKFITDLGWVLRNEGNVEVSDIVIDRAINRFLGSEGQE